MFDRASLLLLLLLLLLAPSPTDGDGRSLVTLNPSGRVGIGIQLTVPLSFFMPPGLGIFNGRAGRLLPDAGQTCFTDQMVDGLRLLQLAAPPLCQQRFVCELAADAARLQPLSGFLLRHVAPPSGTRRLARAANVGRRTVSAAACARRFGRCPLGVEAVVDPALLDWWKLLSSVVL